MERYRNLHLWLLIPFAIVMLGFMPSYWSQFTSAPWRHHLHGLSATLWFVLLIAQPWLVTRGHAKRHRLIGMLGLFLAGAVTFSALGVIPYNLVNELMPQGARYALSFVDIVVAPGFAVAVIMAIVNSRSMPDHARWMISTVFWAVSPGLFRFMFIIADLVQVEAPGRLAPAFLAAAGITNVVVLTGLMLRERRAHPAYVLAALGSISMLVALPVGGLEAWQRIADALFTI